LTAELLSLKIKSGNAKSVKEPPKFDIVCPTQNFQKSGLSLEEGSETSVVGTDIFISPGVSE